MQWHGGSTANGFVNPSLTNPTANQSIILINPFDAADHYSMQNSAPRNGTVTFAPTILVPKEEFSGDPINPPIVNPPVIETPPFEEPPVELLPIVVSPPEEATPPAVVPEKENHPAEIKITELLPNPSGTDSGLEKIEVFNAGQTTVNLQDYILDDVTPTDSLSSNAYTLPDLEVQSNNYTVIDIPAGKFAMNNTQGDVVTLFDTTKEELDTVSYTETAPKGESYAKFGESWDWIEPTLGSVNGNAPEQDETGTAEENDEIDLPTDYDNSGLQITEIYANPTDGEKEFLEIYNSGEETAELSVVSVWVGEKHKNLTNVRLDSGKTDCSIV